MGTRKIQRRVQPVRRAALARQDGAMWARRATSSVAVCDARVARRPSRSEQCGKFSINSNPWCCCPCEFPAHIGWPWKVKYRKQQRCRTHGSLVQQNDSIVLAEGQAQKPRGGVARGQGDVV